MLKYRFQKVFSKVGMIIASIQAAGCQEIVTLTNNQLCDFTLLSLSYLKKLLTASTIITSTLVRIPTSTVESFPNDLFSVLLNLINFSPEKGIFTRVLKQAIVKPYIKNVNLDPADFASFQPLSNLSYTSKLSERSALVQLNYRLESNAFFCFSKCLKKILPNWKRPSKSYLI